MIRDLISIFPKRDRALIGILVLAGTGTSLLDVVGIGLLYPYVTILQEPDRIFSLKYLGEFYRALGFQSTQTFIYFASGGLIALFCLKSALAILMARWQYSFVFSRQAALSARLLDHYLARPYGFFQTANSANLIGNVTTSVNNVCNGVVRSGIALLSELVVVVGLLGFLVVLSPGVFLAVVALVGGISAFVSVMIRSRVVRYGEESDRYWKGMIRTANEAIGSAKEIQVLGRAAFFVDLFGQNARGFAAAGTKNAVASVLPRITLETGAVVGLVLISIAAVAMRAAEGSLFALLAVFA
ncbi:MAG: ABC transporter transmembrane domain-containing protein, partial [Propylenella sp.]